MAPSPLPCHTLLLAGSKNQARPSRNGDKAMRNDQFQQVVFRPASLRLSVFALAFCVAGPIGLSAAGCGGDAGEAGADAADSGGDTSAKGSLKPQLGGPPTAAGATGTVAMLVQDAKGKAVAGATVGWQALVGGGKVSSLTSVSDSAGLAKVAWTLGPAPVRQRLFAKVSEGPLQGVAANLDVLAALPQPYTPESWGDVETVLDAAKIDGSTEDLAFGPDGMLHLGLPGGLAIVDKTGKTTLRKLSGDAIVLALGLAFDQQGTLWVADSKGHALRKVSPAGVVSTALTKAGNADLVMPNDVAIDSQGLVWLTDSCGGTLLRFDPKQGLVDRSYSFDPALQGGPNGLALGKDGRVWMTTENIALICGKSVPLQAPVAALFVVNPASPTAAPELVKGAMGLFGDGLTFDEQGNLYAIFDREKDFALTESSVWLFTPEAQAGQAEPVRFLSAADRIYANCVFAPAVAQGFGPSQLYLALLAVPPFTTARGLARFDTGMTGAP